MGTIDRYTWEGSKLTANAYKAYIDNLNCPIITTSVENNTFYIHVDNAYNIFFKFDHPTYCGYQLRGETVDLVNFNPLSSLTSQTVIVCFSDDMFYLQHSGNYSDGRRMISIYEKIEDKRYVANAGAGTGSSDFHTWYSIQDPEMNFLCLENNLYYRHESRLKYTQKPNYIDHTIDNLISGGEITNIVDPNFVSCSTVSTNRVITFNDQNFYTIGSNILFPVD